jgi:centrosomal CEP192-like protein/HYDIN/CFA65/VesB family protein/ASPM-SPD-2-Hydin domain-containing protein
MLARLARRLAMPSGMAMLGLMIPITGSTVALAGAPAVSISPTSFNYGTVAVGTQSPSQAFVLTNTGTADLHVQGITFGGANPSDFRVYIAGCDYHTVSPGATCTEWAVFAPKEAGALSAALSFPDDASGSPQTVALTGVGTGPVMSFAPASLSFDLVPVGQQSAPQTFYVKNTGDLALAVTSATPLTNPAGNIVVISDACSGTSVPAGGICRMVVAFTAAQAVYGGATIQFQANTNPSFQNYNMGESGLGVYAQIYAPYWVYGNQPQNSTSQAQYVQLKNAGNVAMHVGTASITGSGASQFAITADACSGATLNPNSTCNIYVAFAPTTVGTVSAMVSFTDDAPDTPQLAMIQGTGIAPGAIPRPSSIDFGLVSDGGGTASQVVQLSNPTSASLHVTSATISAGSGIFSTSADTCSAATVLPATSCSVTVTFAPPYAFAGLTGTLTFSDDAGQQSVSLLGTGVDPQMTYAPDQLSFGNQRVATRSAAQAFTVTNTSGSNLTPQTQLAGTNPGDFSLDASGCAQALAPGGSCQLLVTFAPTTTLARSAAVNITNPVTGSMNRVPVSGTGVAAVVPASSIIPFGSQRVGATFTAPGLMLTNAGTDTLHVSSVSISGTNATSFALGAGNCVGAAVAPNTSCNVPINFTPPTTGPLSATLNVADDAWNGPSQFPLSGTGVQAHATFTPSSISFPNTVTGQSASQSVSVISDGTASLDVSSITLSGSGAAAYSVSADTCSGQQWPATISCSFKVTFAPTATGSYAASVLVSDDAAGSPQSISLTGTDFQSDATASPSSVSFGAVRQGKTASPQTVTLTNDGGTIVHVTSATVSGDPSFSVAVDSCSGAALSVGTACTVQIGFAPTTLGSLLGSLSFSDDAANSPQAVALSGSGVQPAVSLSATSLAFGNQVVGTKSANQPVVVTNTGTDSLNVGTATVAAPFAIASDGCSNTAVAAGSSCTIQVDFAPTATGPATGSLSIPDDAPGAPHTVALSGTGTYPHATASPSSIAFGSVRAGTTASQTATLTNDGSTTIQVGTTTLAGESIFSLSADTCSNATLSVGAACTVQVNFAPLTSSGMSQLATLTFNDDAANSPQTVAISGTVVQPAVSLSAASLAFGNQLVGTTSASQSVVVTDSGTDTLNLGTALIGGPFNIVADGCSNTAVAAGSSCTIQVDFAPTAMGPVGGKLSIFDDAASSPQTVALSGTGLQPHATASPSTVSFGGVPPGKSASPQTVTLTNDGNTTIHVTSATVTGSGGFSTAADTCSGASLAAGAACTVQVGFAPANLGTFSATLSFNDDAGNSPQTVALSGSGVQPAVSLSASSLAFGNQVVGNKSPNQSVIVTNSGTGTLNVGAATAGAPFAIVTDACSNTAVAPGSSCSIQVAFTPTVTGPASGTLSIPDDAPGSPHAVALSGTGVQPKATVSPSSLSFGNVHVGPGSSANQQYVTVTNTGTSDLHVAGVTLAGDPAFTIGTTCAGATVAPGASCKVGVYASPDTIGSRTGTLQIADDAPGSPQTVALSVTGVDGKLTATPTSFNFGSVRVNTKSSKLNIKVQNTGNATLNIGQVSITGLNPSSFVIVSTSCAGARLSPGASCSVSVYFKPATTGSFSAAVTLANDGLGGAQSVQLTGTGI